jgi:NAD(P)-dependent dehydrogenase (short-subunit alcohol dehydrogenase family)
MTPKVVERVVGSDGVPMGDDRRPVVVVTGASRGIGAGILRGYRSEGWSAVATARTIEPSTEPDLVAVSGDIASAETAERVIAAAIERFGRIDSLINNAGVFVGKPFVDYTIEDYRTLTTVNLGGFFHITQRAVRQMLHQGSGHIVNITTTLVDHANRRSPSALAMLTKGGLAAVTRELATEYADRGIRVNAVAPGVIKTPLHDPQSYEALTDFHPIHRLGDIEDVVGAVLYLQDAPFVTGATLHVDGGHAAGH